MRQAMAQVSALLPLLITIFYETVTPVTSTSCPWDDPDLERWSDATTWASGMVPGENEAVTIPSGQKILLDAPIPRLLTLTIDGALVWGDVDGIKMETSYVLVNGEFHIGSEECKFEKEAHIFLYGMSNSTSEVLTPGDFGRKFIGATSGSRLEIHGMNKQSWSKLVATVAPIDPDSCEIVYDSKTGQSGTQAGIHMTVWDSDGSFLDFDQFGLASQDTSEQEAREMVEKIENLKNGVIVSLAVYNSIGNPGDIPDDFYSTIENLGATKIRDLKDKDVYVFLAAIGKPQTALEKHVRRAVHPRSYRDSIEARVTLLRNDLAFTVISRSKEKSGEYEARFKVLDQNAALPKLSLLHKVNSWKWKSGDEVVVVSTDFDWRQAEVRTLVKCKDCDRNQIRVDGDFEFTHFGNVTFGVDERAEVGLLSRNIHIEAEVQDECYAITEHERDLCDKFHTDTFGGHVKILRGAIAHIEGAQLTHMGQQSLLAKYPLHFHMCDEVPGQYIRNNVIRDSNSRCITIHGTDKLEVSDNVCFNHLGHGIFLEDSAEQNNHVHRNLVLGTLHGTLLPTDMNRDWCEVRDWCGLLSSIWITHPNNRFTENVAAGSDGHGIVFVFSDRPLGPSLERQIERGLYSEMSTRYTKVLEFSKNVAHSNTEGGIWFDSRLSYGIQDGDTYIPENAEIGTNYYSPHDPPNEDGVKVETILSQARLYKNQVRNAWVRCGNIVFANSTFADSPTSYLAAHTTDSSSCDVRHSVFIGTTENRGQPWTYTFNKGFEHLPKSERPKQTFDRSFSENEPDFQMGGMVFYQGQVYVDNCYFDQFYNWYYNDSMTEVLGYRPMSPAAAITFHPNNRYPNIPRNGIFNLKFGFCDGDHDSFRVMSGNGSTPHWSVMDGTRNLNIRDYDGSLTGTPNTQVVPDRHFFTGPECLKKPDWDMAVCPYKYFLLIVRGEGGVIEKSYREWTPVLISRDEQPQDVYAQSGETGHKYIVRVHQSYTIRFNATLGPPPRKIQFRPRFGLESGEVIRLAVCLPRSTTSFSISSKVPQLSTQDVPQWVSSLAELDADTTMKAFFWDQANGYLYLKMSSPYNLRNLDEECPSDQCLEVNIERVDGGDEAAECTSPVTPYIPQVPTPPPVEEDICQGPSSFTGLGAPIESGYEAPPPSAKTCAETGS